MIQTLTPPRAKPVDPALSQPLYAELANSLQSLIEQGTLRPGHRVPSVRRMALQRGVSIATVLQAYTVLENRGYLEARPQSGYYVRPRPPCLSPEPRMAKPMAKPATAFLIGTPASIKASDEPQVEAIDEEPLDPKTSETTRMV